MKTSKEDLQQLGKLKMETKLKEDKKLIDYNMQANRDKNLIAYNMLKVEQEDFKPELLKRFGQKRQISSMEPSMFLNSMTVLTVLVK